MNRTPTHGLQVATPLYDFIGEEVLPGIGLTPDGFWSGFAALVHDLAPRNRALLARRDDLQAQIDEWHDKHKGSTIDPTEYEAFLRSIGYLLPGRGTLHGRDEQCGCRNRQHRRTAACGTREQCPLCPERGQCPLGQPIRRALRHRCDR